MQLKLLVNLTYMRTIRRIMGYNGKCTKRTYLFNSQHWGFYKQMRPNINYL